MAGCHHVLVGATRRDHNRLNDDVSILWRTLQLHQSTTSIRLGSLQKCFCLQISLHGNIAFANLNRQGQDFRVGPSETNWPKETDPAMMALYLCQQQVLPPSINLRYNEQPNVHFRLVLRTDMTSTEQKLQCQPGIRDPTQRCYLQSSDDGDRFLNTIMFDLQRM